jgi:hypothetical protein
MDAIVKFYHDRIIEGKTTIERVPLKWRAKVEGTLNNEI